MRLADRDTSAGARAVRVRCLVCGTRRPLVDMYADLDGPPFEAYYCRPAGDRIISERTTQPDGCVRFGPVPAQAPADV